MNYACPLCHADLRGRVVAKARSGESAGRTLICPACGGALAIHPHPAEKLFFPGVLVALLGLNIYSGFSGIKLSLEGALVMGGLIFAAAYGVRHLIPGRDWPRYQPAKPGRPG